MNNSVRTYFEKAIEGCRLCLDQKGRLERIHDVAVSRSQRWSASEEKARADFYGERICRYGYPEYLLTGEIS